METEALGVTVLALGSRVELEPVLSRAWYHLTTSPSTDLLLPGKPARMAARLGNRTGHYGERTQQQELDIQCGQRDLTPQAPVAGGGGGGHGMVNPEQGTGRSLRKACSGLGGRQKPGP